MREPLENESILTLRKNSFSRPPSRSSRRARVALQAVVALPRGLEGSRVRGFTRRYTETPPPRGSSGAPCGGPGRPRTTWGLLCFKAAGIPDSAGFRHPKDNRDHAKIRMPSGTFGNFQHVKKPDLFLHIARHSRTSRALELL